ncbi:SpoIID/LytB domain-containing protein [Bacillus alkalicellulosilyticus]|uniref:SpoIID/LytB domain-containing protein n=1 Tax=Alkalihalobacterium alkalicellulosilyticum TaxID=1912214 RepID=UPI00099845B3|nr:SpoIID/LytB domain-containing protein [Bacillus alkalicellulosilyticus]
MRSRIAVVLVFFILFLSIDIQSPVAISHGSQQPTVSVKLVNYIGNVNELSINLAGTYTLHQGSIIEGGKTYRLRVENGQIAMYDGTTKLFTFSEYTFTPQQYNEQHLLRINNRPYMGTLRFIMEGTSIRPTNTLLVEDYLKGVVPSEMPASWHIEALKAQSIAARTYVMSQGSKVIDDTINYQVYSGYAWHQNSTRAVNETSGQTLTHNNRLISAVYSSSNGGFTESNANVWGGTSLSYLPIKQDPFDSIDPWSFSIYKAQIDMTNRDLKDPAPWWSTVREKDVTIVNNMKRWLYNNGYQNTEIKIVAVPTLLFSEQRTTGGRVRTGDLTIQFYVRSLTTNDYVRQSDGSLLLHTLDLKNTSAQRIRSIIGINLVRSYLIDKVTETGQMVTVNGRGWGHGVGMSQWGAKRMADQGNRVHDILQFYYPGTTLTPVVSYPVSIVEPIPEPIIEIQPITVNNARAEYDSKHNQIIIRYMLNQDALVTMSVSDSTKQLQSTFMRDLQRKAGELAQYWTVPTGVQGPLVFSITAVGSNGQSTSTLVNFNLPSVTAPPVTELEQTGQPSQTVTTVQPIQNPITTPVVSPVQAPLAKVGTQVTANVNVNVANIRKSASTNSTIVGKAHLNQKVTILGRTGNFYRIQRGKTRGFIHVNLLTINQTLTQNGRTVVVINGKVADTQGNVRLRNKTVYVPLKGVVENVKMTYNWNRTSNRVTLKDSRTTIQMTVDSKQARRNAKTIRLTNQPELLNSRVYVSLRTCNEVLGATTHWDHKAGVVWIQR